MAQIARTALFSLAILLLPDSASQLSAVIHAAEQADELGIPATNEGLAGDGPIRRADWFHNVWNSRRAEFQKSAPDQKGAVVFLGDSITQGWGNQTDTLFAGVKIANRGISGDTTRGMLYRLEADVLSLEPAAVVMLMGTNDLEEKATPQVIAGNVALIIEAILKHNPKTPVVLCQIFPSSASMNRPADKIKETNALLMAYAKGKPEITVIDTWTLYADENGDAPVSEFPDLLHLNESGYTKWAAALRPILATLGLTETEADGFQPEAGFEMLFNGRDLTGWSFKTNSETTVFDGATETPDHRYKAINGRLVVTTPPEGRRVQQLWTTRQFPGDFVMKLEFRATPNADSGVFIRQPQLQCRDYRLAGPYKNLKSYKPQDWNELEVTVKGNVAYCTCNGEVLEAEFKLPETGPIGLEGDQGQMEYRRIRVKQLP